MNSDIQELLETAELVFDTQGKKTAVMLDYSIWKDLLQLLEDIEDSAEIEASQMSGEEPIPWEQARAELRARDVNV